MGDLPKRRPNRLKGYDYSQAGYYYVTVCTKGRKELFWKQERAGLGPAPTPRLNQLGRIVADTWGDLPQYIPDIELDRFVVMPNHIHGIIRLRRDSVSEHADGSPPNSVGAGPRPAGSPVALSEVMRQFKSFSARRVNTARGTSGAPVWQRGYHDHIIRNDADYLRIWEYMNTNPAKWREDRFYSGARMVRPVTPPPV